MRVESPELFEKVHPIRADYSAIDLDIDAADRAMLSSEVQVSRCNTLVGVKPAESRLHAVYCIFVVFCMLSALVGNSINGLLCENFCV